MLHFLLKSKDVVDLDPLVDDNNISLFDNILNNNENDNLKNKIFEIACGKGQLKFVKWMGGKFGINSLMETYGNNCYSSYSSYNSYASKNDNPFLSACDNGQLDVAKYIFDSYNVADQFDITENLKYSFCNVCEFGYLDMAAWLYENFTEWMEIHLVDDYAFRWACTNGHIDVAKWLITLDDIDEVNVDDAFCSVCVKNEMAVAKWLISLDPYINIHMSSDMMLERVLMYGHIDMAKWLVTLDDISNFNLDWNCLFNYICAGGHLDVAKWIISIKPEINTANRYCLAFSYACENGHLELAKWLLEVEPEVINAEDVLTMTAATNNMDILEWLWTIDGVWKSGYYVTHAFVAACKAGYLKNMKWLYNKGGVDIHMMSEYPLRMACENNNSKTFNWIISLDNQFDIRAFNDYAFNTACQKNNIYIAQYLKERCDDYKMVVVDNKVTEYRIVDCIEAALSVVDTDYNKALEHLGITNNKVISENPKSEYDNMCIICRSNKDKLILLSCKHTYCLNCLLLWHQSIKKTDNFRCAYCQTVYGWKDCTSLLITN